MMLRYSLFKGYIAMTRLIHFNKISLNLLILCLRLVCYIPLYAYMPIFFIKFINKNQYVYIRNLELCPLVCLNDCVFVTNFYLNAK